jgi:hypothetical protein
MWGISPQLRTRRASTGRSVTSSCGSDAAEATQTASCRGRTRAGFGTG